MKATFGEDLEFLRAHGEPLVLAGEGGEAQVALAPLYQGRVMTSTLAGPGGKSQGWINREQVAAGARAPHMSVWGGEDRYWIGPEGGQHSIFFAPGAAFDLARWQVPEALDWGAWDTLATSPERARFGRHATLESWSGVRFSVACEREIRLLARAEVARLLGGELPEDLRLVAFSSDNTLANAGPEPWCAERGLLSIWTVGMFPASEACTIVVRFRPGPERRLGPPVRADYFGLPGPDRFGIDRRRGLAGLKADGRFRCKLGVPRLRAFPWVGAWDAQDEVLTLVHYDLPERGDYADARWRLHEDPYDGDVVNVYNDGPSAPGSAAMGDFFELETSSPVRALAPGEGLRHVHRTLHLGGPREETERVAQRVLGVGLAEVEAAFPD